MGDGVTAGHCFDFSDTQFLISLSTFLPYISTASIYPCDLLVQFLCVP